jgi:phospholipid/cholesterol/gamma-HCH transport system substrate-binding protein
MPSQQGAPWSRMKIGLVVAVPAAVLALAVFVIAGGPAAFSHRLTATIYLGNSAGLKAGAPVDLDGVTIGTVRSVTMVTLPGRKRTPVQVVMALDRRFQPSLHTDSLATVDSAGVLADTAVDINSESAVGPLLEDGGELKTLEIPSGQEMMSAGQTTTESLNALLGKMDTLVDHIESGKGSVGQFMNNPDIDKRANAIIHEAQVVTGKLNSNGNTVGRVLNDVDKGSGPWTSPLNKITSLTQQVQNGDDAAGRELKDETFRSNLSSASAHASALQSEINAGKGGVGMLMNDPEFARKMTDTTAKTNALVTGLNGGKGSLGKWTAEDGLASLTRFESESAAVAAMIRKDPKKYLTIEVRLF